MGAILKRKGLTTFAESLIVLLVLGVVLTGVYFLAPGLRVAESKTLDGLTINDDRLDNTSNADLIALPSTSPSTAVISQPRVRIAGYAWNGETPIITANGGPITTKGSLMEANNVNLEIVRQDWLSELRAMQMKFIEQYDRGNKYPDDDKSAFAIMMMGDGAPFYISTMQSALDNKFGKDKYHVQVIGAFGMSNGEDKLIGPKEWKTNPKSMLGSLISTVPGDGDWVILGDGES